MSNNAKRVTGNQEIHQTQEGSQQPPKRMKLSQSIGDKADIDCLAEENPLPQTTVMLQKHGQLIYKNVKRTRRARQRDYKKHICAPTEEMSFFQRAPSN